MRARVRSVLAGRQPARIPVPERAEFVRILSEACR